MMASRKVARLITMVILVLAVTAGAQTKSQPTKKAAAKKTAATEQAPPPLETKAIELLKATSAKLAAAKTVSFNAVEVFESPSRHNHPLAYATKYEVKMSRPNKLRVIIAGDGAPSEFYYDGKTVMAYAPAEDLLAVATAPATIDATLEAVYHDAGIYYPFTDLLVADPYKDMEPGLELAYYIGQSQVVGGVTTDMVAYVDGGAFIQVWIGAEDKLPRMVRAVYLEDPLRLRHELVISDWQLDAGFPDDTFATAKSATAKRINFAHPHPQQPPSATKPATTKAKKAN